jgi:thioredoxin-related protein
MKNLLSRLFFSFLLLTVLFHLSAQPVLPPNKSGLPPFKLTQANGSFFSLADLHKNQPVLIVYFDPGCDHCEGFIQDLLLHEKAYTGIQVVLVTYVPVQALKSFVSKFGLGKYPGIKVGTEGTSFVVRYHYNVVQFPYLALHDKTGKLMATFESEVPGAGEVADMFK